MADYASTGMTILVTEIHVPPHLQQCSIVFAADQRITLQGKPPQRAHKVFKIAHLNAGIGYAGIAHTTREYLASWLPNFIRHTASVGTLREFAERLQQELNRNMGRRALEKHASIFHVCGFNADNMPELWHIRNCEMEGNFYANFKPQYELSEDFLSRDAIEDFHFDGTNPSLGQWGIEYYINGDVRPFRPIWRRLDKFMAEMFSYGAFGHPPGDEGYVAIVKWKMGVIASFYHQFADEKIIGGPIDVFVLHRR